MFQQNDDRGPPTSLRGWLSDVYFPALMDRSRRKESHEALARRLGNRATVDAPIFGRAAGMAALEAQIKSFAEWLEKRGAMYERQHFTTGVDRDVTEGVLALSLDQKVVELPLAVVAEKRRSREVELRVYFSSQPIEGKCVPRKPLVPVLKTPDLPLPADVERFLEALEKGDIRVLVDAFEGDGGLREARGMHHARAGGGLEEFFSKLLAGGAFGGTDFARGGAADDGRRIALEYTMTKSCGRACPPQAGLAIFERGDSGRLRAVRLYDDIDL